MERKGHTDIVKQMIASSSLSSMNSYDTSEKVPANRMHQSSISIRNSAFKTNDIAVIRLEEDYIPVRQTNEGLHLPSTNRFNPFNQANADDHSDLEEGDVSISPVNDHDVATSLAELGLAEDHFSCSEDHLGLSSSEELETAIKNCKDMILKLPNNSKKRKKLVENLVELRITKQNIEDKADAVELYIKTVLGHKLGKRKSYSTKNNCDCCRNSIWGMMQVWYLCQDCGFACHAKCVNNIRRMCVADNARSLTSFNLDICPEVGLSKQSYCCAECKTPIGIGGTNSALICNYNGLYYCTNCHWNDLMVIPGRIVHNWDHSPQKVCRQSYQLLSQMFNRPILNIECLNPMLFNYVEELSETRRMREHILKMKSYFLTCTTALEMKLLCKLEDRQHFVENSNMYSLKDLVDIQMGNLMQGLTDIYVCFIKHIKIDCLICQAKGFVCEICNAGEILFPFDAMTSCCPNCSAVFHSDCFICLDTMCPRCKRKQKKHQLISLIGNELEDDFLNPKTSLQESTSSLQYDGTFSVDAGGSSGTHNSSYTEHSSLFSFQLPEIPEITKLADLDVATCSFKSETSSNVNNMGCSSDEGTMPFFEDGERTSMTLEGNSTNNKTSRSPFSIENLDNKYDINYKKNVEHTFQQTSAMNTRVVYQDEKNPFLSEIAVSSTFPAEENESDDKLCMPNDVYDKTLNPFCC